MVYFVADETASWERAKRGMLDGKTEQALRDLPFAGDPDSLGLTVLEKRASYTIGHGLHVVPDGAPTRAWWSGRGKYALPDFAAVLGYQLVSEDFRALIEEFEPGVHQFIPVDVYKTRDGEELWGTWYWLNICNRIDSTDHDAMRQAGWFHTDIAGTKQRGMWRFDRKATRWNKPPIIFSREGIGNAILWVDPYLNPRNFYARDVFAQAVQDRGLTGCSLTQQQEV